MLQRLVTCNGCFNGLHAGHLFYLGYAAAQGTHLIVGINDDPYIRRVKNVDPIPAAARKSALEALGFISKVHVFSRGQRDPCAFIEQFRPAVHCIGAEYLGVAAELETCIGLGVQIVWVPRVGPWSTSGASA